MVTIDDAERILLVKRSVDPKKGFWCLPGGFMELDETPEGAGLTGVAGGNRPDRTNRQAAGHADPSQPQI
jgi:8-oxo-dGTP pyrophosphatase MutT (NUDIX family)